MTIRVASRAAKSQLLRPWQLPSARQSQGLAALLLCRSALLPPDLYVGKSAGSVFRVCTHAMLQPQVVLLLGSLHQEQGTWIGINQEPAVQVVGGPAGERLAGRVLMQLGAPEKAVTDAVKEVIRILKKTQAARVPQVWMHGHNVH